MRTAVPAALLIGAPIVTGAVGALAAANAPSFYGRLEQPAWAPPPAVFGPVWTALYLMMGVAAFLVWRSRGWERARGTLTFFLVHLIVNGLWSWLFFHWRQPVGSCLDISILWVMVAALVILFFRFRPLAGALLAPYLAWVTFAAALNFTLVRLNPNL